MELRRESVPSCTACAAQLNMCSLLFFQSFCYFLFHAVDIEAMIKHIYWLKLFVCLIRCKTENRKILQDFRVQCAVLLSTVSPGRMEDP